MSMNSKISNPENFKEAAAKFKSKLGGKPADNTGKKRFESIVPPSFEQSANLETLDEASAVDEKDPAHPLYGKRISV